jgi:hypothetical protein
VRVAGVVVELVHDDVVHRGVRAIAESDVGEDFGGAAGAADDDVRNLIDSISENFHFYQREVGQTAVKGHAFSDCVEGGFWMGKEGENPK